MKVQVSISIQLNKTHTFSFFSFFSFLKVEIHLI
jgi:hypothetical protein